MSNLSQENLKNLLFKSEKVSEKSQAFQKYILNLSTIYNALMFSDDKTVKDVEDFIDKYKKDFPYILFGYTGDNLSFAKSYIACGDKNKINISFIKALDNYEETKNNPLEVGSELFNFNNVSYSDNYYQEFEAHRIAYFLQLLGCQEAVDKLIEKEYVLSFTKQLNQLNFLIGSPSARNDNLEELESRIEAGVERFFDSKNEVDNFFKSTPAGELPYKFRGMYNRLGYQDEAETEKIYKKDEKIPMYLITASMIVSSVENRADYDNRFSYTPEAVIAYMTGLEKVYDRLENPKHKEKMKELINFIILQDKRFREVVLEENMQHKLATWIGKGLFSLDLSYDSSQHHILKNISLFSDTNFTRYNTITPDTPWLYAKFRNKKQIEEFKAVCEKEVLSATIKKNKTIKKPQTFKV